MFNISQSRRNEILIKALLCTRRQVHNYISHVVAAVERNCLREKKPTPSLHPLVLHSRTKTYPLLSLRHRTLITDDGCKYQ